MIKRFINTKPSILIVIAILSVCILIQNGFFGITLLALCLLVGSTAGPIGIISLQIIILLITIYYGIN